MVERKATGVPDYKGDAEKVLKRADAAFRRSSMTRAYHLYGDAIARFEMLHDSTHNRAVGLQLAEAYIRGCYPAWRLAHRGRKADRNMWMARAFEREGQGVNLQLQLSQPPADMTDQEIVGVICHVHNLATDTLHHRKDDVIAEHFIDEAYKLLKAQRPNDDKMPDSLHFGFQGMRARIALKRGEFAKSLALVEEQIAYEQGLVDKARRKHKKLPPKNWLKLPLELRDEINQAIMQAAVQTVLDAKI